MLFGALLASGRGLRAGGDLPKQFQTLAGEPLLVHSLRTLCAIDDFDGLLLALAPDQMELGRELLTPWLAQESRLQLVAGGATRQETVLALVKAALQRDPDAWLVTHDAARPFVSPQLLQAHINARADHQVVDTIVPLRDSLATCADGVTVTAMPSRSSTWAVQTPQSFHAAAYLSCWQSLTAEEQAAQTDACGVFLACGQSVHALMGEVTNIKITEPLDFLYAEVLYRELSRD